MTIGRKLKELRGNRTQQEIADQLGISRSRYSHYETDRVEIDFGLLQKISNLFGVSIDYLLGREFVYSDISDLISEEEFNVLNNYRNLDNEDKAHIKWLIDRLDSKNKK